MDVFTVLGSLGGIVAFGTAVYVILRGLFAQTTATKDNTKAIEALTSKLDGVVTDLHETREDVAFLKGRSNKDRRLYLASGMELGFPNRCNGQPNSIGHPRSATNMAPIPKARKPPQ